MKHVCNCMFYFRAGSTFYIHAVKQNLTFLLHSFLKGDFFFCIGAAFHMGEKCGRERNYLVFILPFFPLCHPQDGFNTLPQGTRSLRMAFKELFLFSLSFPPADLQLEKATLSTAICRNHFKMNVKQKSCSLSLSRKTKSSWHCYS